MEIIADEWYSQEDVLIARYCKGCPFFYSKSNVSGDLKEPFCSHNGGSIMQISAVLQKLGCREKPKETRMQNLDFEDLTG